MLQSVKVGVLGLVERCLQGEISLDVTTVETPAPVEVTIVGIAMFGTADGLGPTTFTAFTLEGAERYVTKEPGIASAVLVQAEPGVSQRELVDRIQPLGLLLVDLAGRCVNCLPLLDQLRRRAAV